MFKGSDSRKNLELTFGTFTEEIRNLEGKEVMQCFVSIQEAQLVGFPTTSGGKKSNHLVGSSACGLKSDHLVGDLTTCCSKKNLKTKTWSAWSC